jgi:hypothetical protein
MDRSATNAHDATGRPTHKKHLYSRPKLQNLGKLHLHTQGTGPNNGDAGQNMMSPGGGGGGMM